MGSDKLKYLQELVCNQLTHVIPKSYSGCTRWGEGVVVGKRWQEEEEDTSQFIGAMTEYQKDRKFT